MAVSWGPWDYGSGSPPRGMRVGIETTFSAVSNTSTTVTAYYDVWTQNDLTWGGDAQQFDFDANFDGAETYSFQNNGDDPETKMRVTKTYKYTYPSTSYGSSPATADFGAEVNNTYNGMNPTHAVHVPIPARPYGAPVAPDTCVATRVSDTSTTVSWQRNATTGKPYNALWLERFVYGYESWTRKFTLAGTPTSQSDTTVVANRKYAYRVQADNTIATSGYAQSGDIYTTPAAPTTPVRTQSGTDQVLTWALAVGYTEYATEIWRAVDGVYSLLATVAAGVTTYTDTTSLSSTKVKYKFRTKTTVGTQLYSADSAETTETAGVLTAPTAPTLLVPSTGTLDPTEAIQHSWRHNPTDGTAQTAYQVQYRYVGDSTWIQTGKITGTASSWTMPANTRDKGRQVEWQVQTWGGSATASPFSTTATWTTSPIIAVKYPLFLDLTSGRTEADSTGTGIPLGGTTGQVLAKASATNKDTVWSTLSIPSPPVDTGWISGGSGASVVVADATNFTLTGSFVRIKGGIVSLYISGTMKVVSTFPNTGDIGNLAIGVMVSAYRPVSPPTTQALHSGGSGRVVIGSIDGNGTLTIASVGGTLALAIGDTISLGGTYFL